VKNAARRLVIVPFETAIALLLIATGITGIFHAAVVDPVDALLPHPEAVALYAMSAFTGLLMAAGIAASNRGTEIAGLLFLTAVILDRFILYGYYLGFGASFIVTGIFDSAIVWAALTRLHTVRKRRALVMIQNGQALDDHR
jgi:hypothetical protein